MNVPFANFRLEFGKDGNALDPRQAPDCAARLEGITDLLVMSHGWNNDMAEAQGLYELFFGQMSNVLRACPVAGVRAESLAAACVFWPSKKFADPALIPGGAAAFQSDPGGAAGDLLDRAHDQLMDLIDTPDARAKLTEAKGLAGALDSPAVQERWMAILQSLAPPPGPDREEGVREIHDTTGTEAFAKLRAPVMSRRAGPSDEGGAATIDTGAMPRPAEEDYAAAGLQDVFDRVKRAAIEALNLTTYYVMKDRAGLVGRSGLNAALRTVQAARPAVRLHLVGHSFGARVVTSAAKEGGNLNVASVSLLQAAFSHFGFSNNYDGAGSAGFFRDVIAAKGRLSGPMLITHTVQDKAVGQAYAIASRLAGQMAASVGDAGDPYGGLGRNGAQKTPEATDQFDLLPLNGRYTFQAGRIYNLQADAIIKDHGDIAEPEVAYAVLNAVGSH